MKRTGIAISATGHLHRIDVLTKHVRRWCEVALGHILVITVDGDKDAVLRVKRAVPSTVGVYQVGQPHDPDRLRDGRAGVAVNKNTGIELLMDLGVEELFLSDSDCSPRSYEALTQHTRLGLAHSMVCWGKSRLSDTGKHTAVWTWPRGVLLHVRRSVIETLGGMDENFGPGGHEHVEFSRRIHQKGITPFPFMSPVAYAQDRAQGARKFWDCEDMPRPGEPNGALGSRRRLLTSVYRQPGDWGHIEHVMRSHDGQPRFVPFTSSENGRSSAILSTHL